MQRRLRINQDYIWGPSPLGETNPAEGPEPREAHTRQPHAEFNAGHIDVFLAERTLLADVATVCAQSTFERPLAGVRDPDASYLDLASADPHGLALRRGEPVAD
jgi:hypothetical protein